MLSINIKIKIYRIIILPLVLNWCETWSLTMKEERRVRLFENRVLRRVFGPKTEDVTGEWRTLHKEEINNPYFSPNTMHVIESIKNKMGGSCSTYVGRGEVHTGFVWET